MRALIPLLVIVPLLGCDDSGTSTPTPAGSSTAANSAVIEAYAGRVEAAYKHAAAKAAALEAANKALVAAPSEGTLAAAREAWIKARQAYSPTEAYRFVDGPIDGEGGPEGLINAWPIDESYLDYVKGKPTAGLVQDPKTLPTITPETLAALNEQGGEANVSTGFHAIEFLLWGQDQSTQGPGERSFEDYLADEMDHAGRRGQVLLAASALLTKQLEGLALAWAPGAAYRVEFLAEGTVAMGKILTSLAMLAGDEIAAERMATALAEGDQEHEQCCFSDTTIADHLANLAGIRAVLEGEHGALELFDAEGKANVEEALAGAEAAVKAIPAPFDQAITSEAGKPKIQAAVSACEALADAIVAAGKASGLAVEGP